MSTKRRRVPRHWHEPHLRLELTDWLLEGAVRQNDARDLQRNEAVYDVFIEFFDEPDLRALWHLHRAELLAEWRRRGGCGEPWGAQFDRGGRGDRV